MLVQSQKRQLDELGYLVLPGFVPPPLLTELRERVETLWELEGDEPGPSSGLSRAPAAWRIWSTRVRSSRN